MNEPVVPIDVVKRQATEAALAADRGETPYCPYAHGTDAAHHWAAEFNAASMSLPRTERHAHQLSP